MRVLHIVICGLSISTVFSTLSPKRHDLKKKVVGLKMCVLIFARTVTWNIYNSKKNWASFYKRT